MELLKALKEKKTKKKHRLKYMCEVPNQIACHVNHKPHCHYYYFVVVVVFFLLLDFLLVVHTCSYAKHSISHAQDHVERYRRTTIGAVIKWTVK